MNNQNTANIEILEQKIYTSDVADEIAFILNEAITENGVATISLSGGSTPAQIYRALATPPRINGVDWSKVKFFIGDERYVPHDDPASNFGMVKKQLFSFINDKKPQIFAVDTKINPVAQCAIDYETVLKKEISQSEKSESGIDVPVFDLILLGMGEDGHTASLFPNTPELSEKEKIFVSTINPKDNSIRLSLTFEPLLVAKRIIFLVTGAKKAQIVKKVINGIGDFPAGFYKNAKGRITFFLDTSAGAEL